MEKKNSSLFFKHFGGNANDKFNVDEVTIGFKILSAIFEEGVSAKHVAKLEKKTSSLQAQNENFSEKVDNIIEVLCSIEKSLSNMNFFKSLMQWKQNIMGLTSVTIALEYVAILYKLWVDLSCSTKNANNIAHKQFRRYAFILLDRLIYEYINGKWKGSGDSKLASDLRDYKKRYESPVSEEDWFDILEKSCTGAADFKPVILFYDCAVRTILPERTINFTWDIDHIIPKIKLNSTNSASPKIIDGLANRTLLHKSENIAKHDKFPSEITDPCIIDSLIHYAGLSREQLKKYKSPGDLEKLIQDRIDHFMDVFLEKRKAILNEI